MPLKIDMENVIYSRERETNFSTLLLRLIFKADRRHRAMLKQVFPNAVQMIEQYSSDGEILDLPYD